VPPYFAMRLSFPEAVTPHNVERLRQLVINGANHHPGALAVEDCTGAVISLAKLDAKVCVLGGGGASSLAGFMLSCSLQSYGLRDWLLARQRSSITCACVLGLQR